MLVSRWNCHSTYMFCLWNCHSIYIVSCAWDFGKLFFVEEVGGIAIPPTWFWELPPQHVCRMRIRQNYFPRMWRGRWHSPFTHIILGLRPANMFAVWKLGKPLSSWGEVGGIVIPPTCFVIGIIIPPIWFAFPPTWFFGWTGIIF